jgi:hypothetical protein
MQVTHKQKNEVLADIQLIVGPTKVNISSIELDYICGLDGAYQHLAIMQAALGQMIMQKVPMDTTDALKKQIEEKGKQIADAEVAAYHQKQIWVDKFGEVKYDYSTKKLEAVSNTTKQFNGLVTEKEIEKELEENKIIDEELNKLANEMAQNLGQTIKKLIENVPCPDCVDGLVTSPTGAVYPCYCDLGLKHTKGEAQSGKKLYQQSKAYQQAQMDYNSLGVLLGGITGSGVTGGITEAVIQKQPFQSTQSVQPVPDKIEVKEEPKGRKFRDA